MAGGKPKRHRERRPAARTPKPDLTDSEEAGRGVALAQQLMIAKANGDDGRLLELVNGASHAELAWASAYLAGCVWGTALASYGDEETARRVVIAGASDPTDVSMAQVAVIIHEAARDIT